MRLPWSYITLATRADRKRSRCHSLSHSPRAGLYSLQQACNPPPPRLSFPRRSFRLCSRSCSLRVWTLKYAPGISERTRKYPTSVDSASHELKLPVGGNDRSMRGTQQDATWYRLRTCRSADHIPGLSISVLLALREVRNIQYSFSVRLARK